jgi:hypothetical protein
MPTTLQYISKELRLVHISREPRLVLISREPNLGHISREPNLGHISREPNLGHINREPSLGHTPTQHLMMLLLLTKCMLIKLTHMQAILGIQLQAIHKLQRPVILLPTVHPRNQ